VDHLLGRTKGVSEGEAEMSTFGIGRELGAGAWRDLIEQLLFEGLLAEQPNDGRPLIALADREGVQAVYRGTRKLAVLKAPQASGEVRPSRARRGAAPIEIPPADSPLFDALRAWRWREAQAQGVPPYVIFHDQTLLAISRIKPETAVALLTVGGVGQAKLERYGAAILSAVIETLAREPQS
jgi:ATP-dependent DNA helicase RecQ